MTTVRGGELVSGDPADPSDVPAAGVSRREFLRGGVAVVVGGTAAGGLLIQQANTALADDGGHTKYYDSFPRRDEMEQRLGMVVDLRRCVGCRACTVACKTENNVPGGVSRTWVKFAEVGEYPNTRPRFLPSFCNHCDNPPCVPVCPVLATYKRDDGLVLIDYDQCIGCGYCVQACPYGARYVNPVQRTADKCTLCAHRLAVGQKPACVTTCIGGALILGDLNDPQSEISKLVAAHATQTLRPELGTAPMFFYIGLDDRLAREVGP